MQLQQRVTLDDRIKEEMEKYKSVKVPILDKQFPRINPKTSDLPIYLQVNYNFFNED